MAVPIVNAFTVDIDDWLLAHLGPGAPVTSRVVGNMQGILDLLGRHRVRATFFALGRVCAKFPELLREVRDRGHEIGSHGYSHQLVHRMSETEFVDDVRRSQDVIASQSGCAPAGYRAPAFSVTNETPWFGATLERLGFQYSSSVFPIRGRRYGDPTASRFPHQWPHCRLWEFPLSTIRVLGRNVPVAGGGYLRLFPWPVLRQAIRRIHQEAQPAVVYLHPYELDVRECSELSRAGYRFSRKSHITQSLFRGRVAGRLNQLLQTFRFAPMNEVLGLVPSAG